MKRLILILVTIAGIQLTIAAQTLLNGGIGYFGETGFYPGLVLELEKESYQSDHLSTPLRINLGYYSHPRNHAAFFLDVHHGLRRTFSNGIMLESSVGIGVMLSLIFGVAVETAFAQGQRLAVFEAFLRDT